SQDKRRQGRGERSVWLPFRASVADRTLQHPAECIVAGDRSPLPLAAIAERHAARSMDHAPIVPQQHVARLPDMIVGTALVSDVFRDFPQQRIALITWQTKNMAREHR